MAFVYRVIAYVLAFLAALILVDQYVRERTDRLTGSGDPLDPLDDLHPPPAE